MTGDGNGTALLADVGGTNTRLALLRDGEITGRESFENDGFAGVAPLLAGYLAGRRSPARLCIALAGPVGPGVARLTNRDWVIAPAELAPALGLPGPQAVTLVNDLTALALALPDLRADQVERLRLGVGPGNGQALVANFGTGFNVGLMRMTAAGPVAFEAELGHAALPAPLAAEVGEGFTTIEHLFSGAGLVRLHAALGGGARTPREVIAQASGGETQALVTVTRMGSLIGRFARELVLFYLPRDGLHITGGMARAVLATTQGRAAFLDALGAPGPAGALAQGMAVSLITDDAAALGGLRRLAEAAQ